MSDLSPEARALLDAASHADDPTPADQDRVARALAVPLGIAALAPAAAQAATVSAASAATVTALKAAAVVAALVAVGLGARARSAPSAPQRPATVSAPAPRPAAARPIVAPPPANVPAIAPVVAPAVAPAVAPFAVEAPPRGASHAPHATTGATDTLQAEIALLGEAHRALNSGDAAGALAHLSAYRERFPHGVLREERDVERVLVLCRLGRDDEAREAARAFLRAHPRSPLAPRVERACAGSSQGEGR